MSAASRARAAERERERAEQITKATDEAEMARCYAIFREPPHGWRYVIVDLPRSIAERYAVEVSEPDLYGITSTKLAQKMHVEAMNLPDMKR